MKLLLDDSEIEEITIDSLDNPNDKGIVITSKVGERSTGKSDLVKEITAIDTIELGSKIAGEINGLPQSSASKYGSALDVGDETTRLNILSRKHNIADKAIASLMDTLELFDPNGIEKQTDIIKAASQLASIVEKVTDPGKNAGNKIELHLYAPKPRPIKEYATIDV